MVRVGVAFFASGFAALVFQIVWQRMLGMFAGSDTVSAALVVGAFLLGLGLGSLVGAMVADRLSPRRALYGFALCEVGVAAFALQSELFLYDYMVGELGAQVTHSLAVFALCFAGLLLPTLLMGASLPLLSRAVVRSLETAARRIGWLYGLNTLGAGIGALTAGWLIIGWVGYVGAIHVAVACNLLAAGLVLWLAFSAEAQAPPEAAGAGLAAAARPGMAEAAGKGHGSLLFWCLLVFLSGYVIVAMEIVWLRLLGQIGHYHAYLFATILGTFLIADGLGMAVGSRLVGRSPDPRPMFFLLQSGGFLSALALLLVLFALLERPPLEEVLSVDGFRFFGRQLAAMVAIVVLVVAPPSFLIGMTFPYAQRAVQRDLSQIGARVGWVQLANIAGNALGAVLTGLASLHLIGTAGTLALLAVISLGLALAWLLTGGRRQASASRTVLAGVAAALVLLLPLTPGNAGLWSRLHQTRPDHRVHWSEDRSGVVLFRGNRDGHGPMFVQGFSQGHLPFLPIHMLLGSVGALIHPAPEKALVIGVGSGGTPFAAGVNPAIRDIQAIELIQPVYDVLRGIAADRPDGAIARLFADPRYRLAYGDGRRAVFQTREQYDVIQADAILPESSHSGLLYSRQFMAQVLERLKPGGLFVQWAPSARVTETFLAAFPYVVLLRPGSILIGSNRPIAFDAEALRARLAAPEARAWLGLSGTDPARLDDIFAQPPYYWTPETPRRLGDILTDTFPRDEFYLTRRPRAGTDVPPP